MPREILFRGKKVINGEWVEGYFVEQNNPEYHAYIIRSFKAEIDNRHIDIMECDIVEVVPETIGQYTGLTDKNGVKIFEGDIIKTKKYGKIVEHYNVNDYDLFVVTYELCTFRLINKNRGFNLADDEYSELEVIGNIHDNPELIGGGNNESQNPDD